MAQNTVKSKAGEIPERQKQFCHAYERRNFSKADEAAREVGYSGHNYGRKLLMKSHIKAYLDKLKAKAKERHISAADRTIKELKLLAFYNPLDIGELFPDGFIFKDVDDIPPDLGKCIKSVTTQMTKHGTNLRIEFYDKLYAIDLLMKHFGIDKPSGSGKGDNPLEGLTLQIYNHIGGDLGSKPTEQLKLALDQLISQQSRFN